MKKYVLLLLITCLSVGLLEVRGSESVKSEVTHLKGVVVDEETGEQLTGVKVKVNNEVTFTDFDGAFIINFSEGETKIVEFELIAYKSISKKLDVKTVEPADLKIKLKPVE